MPEEEVIRSNSQLEILWSSNFQIGGAPGGLKYGSMMMT
jgi:hypothetical protein